MGFQPHWAAGLIEDQLLAAVDDFLAEIDRGLCMADLGAEKSREAFDTLFGRLSDLRRWLEFIEYGHADGPIRVPLTVLFP